MVAVAPREADHAHDGVRLEHRAHDVLRHPEPVLRRSVLGLEIERRQCALRPDPPEHALGHRRVLGEDRVVEPTPLAAPDRSEPGELARRDERQRLVGRFEDVTAFVEQVAPGGLVARDARVQHEVVAPAGDRDRVELDRPERPEDLEHPVEAPRERPRGREEVARDEKATRRLSRDLHLEDTGCASVGRLTWYARRQAVTVASRLDGRDGRGLTQPRPTSTIVSRDYRGRCVRTITEMAARQGPAAALSPRRDSGQPPSSSPPIARAWRRR